VLILYSRPRAKISKLDCTVRCDTGIVEGSHIQVYYDPLICKVIAHGPSRKDAIQTMRHVRASPRALACLSRSLADSAHAQALDSFVIRGVTHNVSFLRALLDHPRFIKGDTTTKFIPDEWPDGFKGTILKHSDRIALLATVYHVHVSTLRTKLSISGQVRCRATGPTLPPRTDPCALQLDSFNAEAEIEKNSAKVVAEVDGKTFTIARRPVPENDRIQAMVDESGEGTHAPR
jgi:propionyl-CoA carboxylase alpha chain